VPLILFFNLSGILCAAVVLPEFALSKTGLQEDLALSLAVLAIGGVMELTPLRPRFLFVPIWAVGAGMTVWHLSKLWL
jgi:hypothetical protein